MLYTQGMEHFVYVLYVGFYAQRNLCDKQNVLLYGLLVLKRDCTSELVSISMVMSINRDIPMRLSNCYTESYITF